MQQNRWKILMFVAVLAFAALACGGSFTTANIADAYMSFDQDGTNQTTVFGQNDIFFAQVDLNNAPDDTVVRVVWIAVDVENTDPNFEMNSAEYSGGDSELYFELTNSQLWPFGEYRADIYLNGELETSLTFYVQ